MKRNFLGLLISGLFLLLQAVPASAEITRIEGKDVCTNPECRPTGPIPILQGDVPVLKVKGPGVNFADPTKLTVSGPGGVIVGVAGTQLVADGGQVGEGQINLLFTVLISASPGVRTVDLGDNKGSFQIIVIRRGKLNSMDPISPPTRFFKEIQV